MRYGSVIGLYKGVNLPHNLDTFLAQLIYLNEGTNKLVSTKLLTSRPKEKRA
jgi:hypothetical protein